ncbi:ABC transporter permease [Mesobacillus boroniphilus]|uniref:Unspecified monosaccharide ABC transport system n=1 Tax=Mesobacillus boroniphilus JCM 21738 TaxID=1294265 RepID=W4RHF6_9BACI|nr:ABC transporter permease [Mesobacillus boroniphilus]GAE43731.1 unspecified monosaccharide ABC transport system [Mesobacillus boroniphilus JCM 21738]
MRNTIVSLISIILGLVAGGILMLFIGSNPIEGYSYLLQGALKNLERIGNTLATATPLVFTGLSVAFAFRTGLFNIGASGQMLVGGLAATAVALTFDLSRPILLLVMVLAGLVAGGLWAFIPGLLKAKFNVHEVVSTIMMNWIAYWTIYYIVPGYFKGEFLETESKKLAESDTLRTPFLTEMFDGSYINLGLFLAVIAVIIIAFIIEKTTLGFELKAVGFNRFAAEYAGMKVNRNIILSMLISGALAGVGGVAMYTGNASSIQIGILPAQGYDGIAVALLGANHPVGVFFAAVLFGILYSGTGS